MGDALEVRVGLLVEFGRCALCGDLGGQRTESGGVHAQRLPAPLRGKLVEALTRKVFSEVSEDEGGSVGVLDSLAGRAVQGLVKDSVADVLGVGAVEVF